MVYDRTRPLTKKNLIGFLRSLNIDVRTDTKARGNQGLYQKNRIDIACGLSEEKSVEVLVHEFAHYIHHKIDCNFLTGGSIEKLFNTYNTDIIKSELIEVTKLTDDNSRLKFFTSAKEEISKTIKGIQSAIKKDYPSFQRSKKFLEFERYIKNSEAKYLVKYDAVKLSEGFFFKKEKILTVKNLEADFPDMPRAFQLYIKLCSLKRKQSRISRRINKLNKYYEKTAELFARFVQGYFKDPLSVEKIAPNAVKRFSELLECGYYLELKDLFEIFKQTKED